MTIIEISLAIVRSVALYKNMYLLQPNIIQLNQQLRLGYEDI